MDDALSQFLGFHTLVFALACFILTSITRHVVETAVPAVVAKKTQAQEASTVYGSSLSVWWNQVILYVLPVFWGATAALVAKMYPFPPGIQATSGRIFFGIVVGFFSGFLFKVVKKALLGKVGASTDADLPSAEP